MESRNNFKLVIFFFLLIFPARVSAANDLIPISGKQVRALKVVDRIVANFMIENDIGAALVAVSLHGKLVYSRAFGWSDKERTNPLNTKGVMRLASVTKPFTAAAIRRLIQEGKLSLNDRVFDLDGSGYRLLSLEPFGEVDSRLADITVDHLLRHRGGWDRDEEGVGDLTYKEIEIAKAFGVPAPPGTELTARWIMGQPLQFDPGSKKAYSNFGYMLLGLIVEEVTKEDFLLYLKREIMPKQRGWPRPKLLLGRTFKKDQNLNEPYYESDKRYRNVFFPTYSQDEIVSAPYGSSDRESRVALGALVANAITIVDFLSRYQVNGDRIGGPRPQSGNWRWNHEGGLEGTNTIARQRGDGIDYAVLFNKRAREGESYAFQIRKQLDTTFDELSRR